MKTSTKFVISAITAIVIYTVASFIALFITGQNIDPALTGAYFAFWTVEIVSLASIKNTKSKRKKKVQHDVDDTRASLNNFINFLHRPF